MYVKCYRLSFLSFFVALGLCVFCSFSFLMLREIVTGRMCIIGTHNGSTGCSENILAPMIIC